MMDFEKMTNNEYHNYLVTEKENDVRLRMIFLNKILKEADISEIEDITIRDELKLLANALVTLNRARIIK